MELLREYKIIKKAVVSDVVVGFVVFMGYTVGW